jgi:hypothetical protein
MMFRFRHQQMWCVLVFGRPMFQDGIVAGVSIMAASGAANIL